ncbi:MAG: hypothetical protein ACOY3I_02530 [Verrucomicrobiota bacterium]
MGQLLEVAVSPRVEGVPTLHVYREEVSDEAVPEGKALAAFGHDNPWQVLDEEMSSQNSQKDISRSDNYVLRVGFAPDQLIEGIQIPFQKNSMIFHALKKKGKIAISTPVQKIGHALKSRFVFIRDDKILFFAINAYPQKKGHFTGELLMDGYVETSKLFGANSDVTCPFLSNDNHLICVQSDGASDSAYLLETTPWGRGSKLIFKQKEDGSDIILKGDVNLCSIVRYAAKPDGASGYAGIQLRFERYAQSQEVSILGLTTRTMDSGYREILMETDKGMYHTVFNQADTYGYDWAYLSLHSEEKVADKGPRYHDDGQIKTVQEYLAERAADLPYVGLKIQHAHPMAEAVRREEEGILQRTARKPKTKIEKTEGYWAKIYSGEKNVLRIGRDALLLKEIPHNIQNPQAIALSDVSSDFPSLFRMAIAEEKLGKDYIHIYDVDTQSLAPIGHAGSFYAGEHHGECTALKLTPDGQVCLGKSNGDVVFAQLPSVLPFEADENGLMIEYSKDLIPEKFIKKRPTIARFIKKSAKTAHVVKPISEQDVPLTLANYGEAIADIYLEKRPSLDSMEADDLLRLPQAEIGTASKKIHTLKWSSNHRHSRTFVAELRTQDRAIRSGDTRYKI